MQFPTKGYIPRKVVPVATTVWATAKTMNVNQILISMVVVLKKPWKRSAKTNARIFWEEDDSLKADVNLSLSLLTKLLVFALVVVFILSFVYGISDAYERSLGESSAEVIYEGMRTVCMNMDNPNFDPEPMRMPVYVPAESYWIINDEQNGLIELKSVVGPWWKHFSPAIEMITGVHTETNLFHSARVSKAIPHECKKYQSREPVTIPDVYQRIIERSLEMADLSSDMHKYKVTFKKPTNDKIFNYDKDKWRD